jgi:hypothetical protein
MNKARYFKLAPGKTTFFDMGTGVNISGPQVVLVEPEKLSKRLNLAIGNSQIVEATEAEYEAYMQSVELQNPVGKSISNSDITDLNRLVKKYGVAEVIRQVTRVGDLRKSAQPSEPVYETPKDAANENPPKVLTDAVKETDEEDIEDIEDEDDELIYTEAELNAMSKKDIEKLILDGYELSSKDLEAIKSMSKANLVKYYLELQS